MIDEVFCTSETRVQQTPSCQLKQWVLRQGVREDVYLGIKKFISEGDNLIVIQVVEIPMSY